MTSFTIVKGFLPCTSNRWLFTIVATVAKECSSVDTIIMHLLFMIHLSMHDIKLCGKEYMHTIFSHDLYIRT